ncbi:MAG: hypothetical protein K0Q76_1201 [Panacagrimonas sp.]|jgi:hypothetical protein|nr:hypothetical protein [Panacagrimonas sp.]MCC2656093.1 hypothetical protein [Panacagrimonas sp.]
MERNRQAHPVLRSLLLAVLIVAPLTAGALTLGAYPLSVFLGGTVVAIVGALMFGGIVRWLPPLAFAAVMLPTVVAAVPVYGGLVAVMLSLGIGAVAGALFYRPTPPEPPRSRTSPYQRRDSAGRPIYGSDPMQTPVAPGHRGDDRHR